MVPLTLRPDQDYELSINTEQFQNFANLRGKPAVPYPIRFRTGDGKAKGALEGRRRQGRGAGPAPRVASANPDDGEADVDPATRKLRVTFDQDMSHDSMSILGGGPTFPADPAAQVRWVDARTLVLPLKLKPGRDYELSFNGGRFQNFRNSRGQSAVPYPIRFRTGTGKGATAKGALGQAEAADAPPRVAKAKPDDGAMDVDPATRELRVTFDQDMDQGGYSIVGGGPTFPGEPATRPRWVDARHDRHAAEAGAEPGLSTEHQQREIQNFRNAEGRPATPYPIRFRTGTGEGEEKGNGAAKKLTQARQSRGDRAAEDGDRRGLLVPRPARGGLGRGLRDGRGSPGCGQDAPGIRQAGRGAAGPGHGHAPLAEGGGLAGAELRSEGGDEHEPAFAGEGDPRAGPGGPRRRRPHPERYHLHPDRHLVGRHHARPGVQGAWQGGRDQRADRGRPPQRRGQRAAGPGVRRLLPRRDQSLFRSTSPAEAERSRRSVSGPSGRTRRGRSIAARSRS